MTPGKRICCAVEACSVGKVCTNPLLGTVCSASSPEKNSQYGEKKRKPCPPPSEKKRKERKGKERKGKERKGKERKGKERKGKERKRKGKERKGKERKGKERKGKERKGKERKGTLNEEEKNARMYLKNTNENWKKHGTLILVVQGAISWRCEESCGTKERTQSAELVSGGGSQDTSPVGGQHGSCVFTMNQKWNPTQ